MIRPVITRCGWQGVTIQVLTNHCDINAPSQRKVPHCGINYSIRGRSTTLAWNNMPWGKSHNCGLKWPIKKKVLPGRYEITPSPPRTVMDFVHRWALRLWPDKNKWKISPQGNRNRTSSANPGHCCLLIHLSAFPCALWSCYWSLFSSKSQLLSLGIVLLEINSH